MNEDLIDHEFVDNWCAYYDELKDHCQQFTPEWAAAITGVPVEDIVASARLYANADAGAIQWGLVFDAGTSSSMHWVEAVCDLMAICGNIEKPGTHVLVHNSFDINAGYSSVDLYADKQALERKFRKWMVGDEGMDFVGMSNCDAMASVLEAGKIPVTGEDYPIKMFYAQSCNAFAGHEGAAARAYKYMSKIPFIVYADPMITPTMIAIADLILPVSMSVERDSARTWWTPLRAMKKVTSYYEAKSDEEIALALGKVLNPELFVRSEHRRGLHQRLPADRPGRGGPGRQGAEGELLRRHRRELGPHLGVRRRWPVHHHEVPLHLRPAGEGRLRACLRRVERHVQQA